MEVVLFSAWQREENVWIILGLARFSVLLIDVRHEHMKAVKSFSVSGQLVFLTQSEMRCFSGFVELRPVNLSPIG